MAESTPSNTKIWVCERNANVSAHVSSGLSPSGSPMSCSFRRWAAIGVEATNEYSPTTACTKCAKLVRLPRDAPTDLCRRVCTIERPKRHVFWPLIFYFLFLRFFRGQPAGTVRDLFSLIERANPAGTCVGAAVLSSALPHPLPPPPPRAPFFQPWRCCRPCFSQHTQV